MKPEVKMSIVISVFNEEDNVKELFGELTAVLNRFEFQSEVIFIDDGSNDRTFACIQQLSGTDKIKVRGVSLSRNFGHQVSVSAGLELAKGDVVITMDGDLQHPPSLIPGLYEKHLQGFDIVNTIRNDDERIGFFKKISSAFFYKTFNLLSSTKIESATADFRLLSRKAVDAFLRFPEKDRFIRGMVVWMGYRQTYLHYKALPRHSGTTKFTPFKMINLSLNAITSFSSAPLRLPLLAGTLIFFACLIYIGYAIYSYLNGLTQPGWASLLISVLFIGAVQLISIGIIGIYLGRVFNETKNRPLYFVKETWESA